MKRAERAGISPVAVAMTTPRPADPIVGVTQDKPGGLGRATDNAPARWRDAFCCLFWPSAASGDVEPAELSEADDAELAALTEQLRAAFTRARRGGCPPLVPAGADLAALARDILQARTDAAGSPRLEDRAHRTTGTSYRLHVLAPGFVAVWLGRDAVGRGSFKHVKAAILVDVRTRGAPTAREVAKVVAQEHLAPGRGIAEAKNELARQIEIKDRGWAPVVDVFASAVIGPKRAGDRAKLVSYQELCTHDLFDVATRARPRPPDPARLALGASALDALAGLHAAGKAHNDIKPENFLVGSDGWVRIGDFGTMSDDLPTSTISGTIGYHSAAVYDEHVSSAVAKQEGIRQREDVYAMGRTLYALLSGVEPPHARAHQLIVQRWRERSLARSIAVFRALSSTLATRDAALSALGAPKEAPPSPLEALLWRMMDPVPEGRPRADEAAACYREIIEGADVERSYRAFCLLAGAMDGKVVEARASLPRMSNGPRWSPI